MRHMTSIIGLAATLVISGSVAMANPALMQKNKPGYPYPGTAATEHFGRAAMQEATVAGNQQGALTMDQSSAEGIPEGKSLLPPQGDPAKISPWPESKDFPLYKGFGPVKSN